MNRCPACKSESVKYLDLQNVSQDTTHEILPPTYKILKCKNCGLYFKDYMPNDIELSCFYNQLGQNEWNYQQVYPHEIFLKNILSKLPDNANVLDIGCNTGRLLKNETRRLNCYGVEINKEAVKIAESTGIKIIAENLKKETLEQNRYDLISLIDVFEHLNDPIPFIDILIKALKPQGKLYIFTGRTDCFPALLCGSYYWYYKPAQHLIFLNRKFIKWFMRNNTGVNVSVIPMRHFFFNFQALLYQISWHIAWRLFSPNSPFKIFAIRNLSRMKEPFMITSWKDHIYFLIERKENGTGNQGSFRILFLRLFRSSRSASD